MRIAFIFDTITPLYQGGYEMRGFELARELVRRGHSVTVFTRAPQDVTIDGVEFRAIARYEPTFDSSGYRTVAGSLRYAAGVARAAVSRGLGPFDIVDCNATPFVHVPAAKLFAIRAGAPMVLSSHEALRADLGRYVSDRQMGRVNRLALRVSYDAAHRLADTVVATAPSAARGLQAEGWRDVVCTTGGVRDVGAPRVGGVRRFVTLSRLATEKRVDTVVRAFAHAWRRHPDATLLVIGDGPCRSDLENLAADLGLGDRVRFTGGVDDEEKLTLLRKEADCYVSASRREGLSVATLEAMAQGCVPVISVDPSGTVINGASEYVVHELNGIITDGTERSLAAAMVRLCDSDGPIPGLSSAAVETAARYTWAAAAEQLELIYLREAKVRPGGLVHV